MGYFLLFLFIIFFVWPLVRVVYTVYTVRKRARKAFEQMFQQAAGGGQNPRGSQDAGRQSSSQSAPAAKRKIIPSDVGEYVRFEEITIETDQTDINSTNTPDSHKTGSVSNSTHSSASSRHIETEQQIIDVEWEDLP